MTSVGRINSIAKYVTHTHTKPLYRESPIYKDLNAKSRIGQSLLTRALAVGLLLFAFASIYKYVVWTLPDINLQKKKYPNHPFAYLCVFYFDLYSYII